MANQIYSITRDPSTERLVLQGSRLRPPSGLYGYQWTVTDETGKKHTLSGITESLSRRLSAYITQINKPVNDGSSELHRLANQPGSRTVVRIFGPYNENIDPKELEKELIASVPEEENLNKTSGGNGGGSWAQYGDPTPTVSTFVSDTPEKYYPFKEKDGRIVAELTPGMKRKGVYCIKNKKTGQRYVGHSTNAKSRARVHASKATHHPEVSTVAKAIAKSPASHVFGLLPSTTDLTPRSERAAEIFHIADKKPQYNGKNKGGGGPAPMRRAKEPLSKKLKLADDE